MNVSKGKWSERAQIVARWFGVEQAAAQTVRSCGTNPPPRIELHGGKLILLTGPSGAGKSTLLHRLRRQCHDRHTSWRDLQQTRLSGELVIDAMAQAMGNNGGDVADEAAIIAALEALSRVGLGEVWTYLRTPAQLSEGQRWRLRLALALARARPAPPGKSLTILAADEFAAPLDQVTALVVASALRKAVSARADLCAIVATSREDLTESLDPDLIVH